MNPSDVTLPSETAVRVARTFKAAREPVWRAFTDPALVSQWLLGPPGWSMPVCEMDVRAGGKFEWRWKSDEDGKEFGFYGEYREVDPHSKIVHTEHYDPGDLGVGMGGGPVLVTVTFAEDNGETGVVTLIESPSKADRDAMLSTGMTDGMEMGYTRLDKLLKTMSR